MKKNYGKIALIIIPIIASLAALLPSYYAYQLEATRAEYLAKAKKATNPTDSLNIIGEFERKYGADLISAKKNQLKLGLDLRGGMYVTMEVDVVKLIEESAQRESIDEIFTDVINKTRNSAKNSDEEVIDIFLKHFNDIARKRGKSLINYFAVSDFRDATEENIITRLKKNATDAIDQAQEVIRQRIDQYGVSEPNIQKTGTRRIILELPGVQNRDQMRSLLQTTARLEFNQVKSNQEIVKAFYKIDKILSNQMKRARGMVVDTVPTVATPDSTKLADNKAPKTDSTVKADSAKADSTQKADTANPYAGMTQDQIAKKHLEDHPFTSMFITYFIPGENQKIMPFYYVTPQIPDGEYMFRIIGDSIAKFNSILNRADIKALMPIDLKIAIDAKPDQPTLKQNAVSVFNFYGLKKDPDLTGEVVTNATASFDPTTNAPIVNMEMNSDGSERWARITGENLHKRIAIVLDDRVYSAPVVQSKITGGRSQITGMANTEEARMLEIVLKAGALKAPVQIIEERVVGPSLGEDSIRTGINASIIAMILVVLYMALYYSKAGLLADMAVVINVLLIIASLAALKGTLSLPGIAGIILTMGMAVDANVLIFERIREELAGGRSLRSAIDEGFKRALTAIIDSNVTTALTSIVLYYLGTGPIQGFALTLLIGIIFTLFTAITVTKAMIEIMISNGATEFNFGQPKLSSSN